jgi:hypothetical protein
MHAIVRHTLLCAALLVISAAPRAAEVIAPTGVSGTLNVDCPSESTGKKCSVGLSDPHQGRVRCSVNPAAEPAGEHNVHWPFEVQQSPNTTDFQKDST